MNEPSLGRTIPYLDLYFGSIVIGRITRIFCSEDTWYGDFEPSESVQPEGDLTRTRIRSFINVFIDRDPDDPPDAEDFDEFSDVVGTGKWFVRTPQGDMFPINDAPVFFHGGDISWRLA